MRASEKRNTSKKKAAVKSRQRKGSSGTPTLFLVGAGLVVGLLILIAVVVSNPSVSTGVEIQGVRVYPNQERGHTNALVTYPQTPPAGGRHNAVWQNCGVYTQPVANENAVHSLEHGAIWITYQPDLAAGEIAKLQQLTRQSNYRLLSPYPGITSPIVASAWGYQLQLDSADDPRLGQFIEKYERNPLGPEPGASCSGGTGQPS